MSFNPEILGSYQTKNEFYEVYKYKKNKDNGLLSKVFVYGAWDVATSGMLDVTGNPIEKLKSNGNWIIFQVYYKDNKMDAKKVVIISY